MPYNAPHLAFTGTFDDALAHANTIPYLTFSRKTTPITSGLLLGKIINNYVPSTFKVLALGQRHNDAII
jgi:hypothetical protein